MGLGIEKGLKRRLAAIVFADVVGYSRLMGEDEVDTMRTLLSYRNLIGAIIKIAPAGLWTHPEITYWPNFPASSKRSKLP